MPMYTGDTVQVIAGSDRNKVGEIISVSSRLHLQWRVMRAAQCWQGAERNGTPHSLHRRHGNAVCEGHSPCTHEGQGQA